jgi:cation transport regulator
MPYKTNEELPKNIRDLVPEKAQNVFRRAFNAAYDQYKGDEKRSFATAWSAVERAGYKKDKDGSYKIAKEDKGFKLSKEGFFESDKDLPEEERRVLPPRAQMLFRKIFNAAMKEFQDDDKSFKEAYKGIEEAGYEKQEDGMYKIAEKKK